MARIRTFIGVDIGKAIRDRAVALQGKLAQTGTEVKWVEAENIHVTLLFLGEVDEREILSICRAVQDTVGRHEPFSMTVEKVGCFPNLRRPRILWIGVGQGSQELCALHESLEPPLLQLGCYRREERKYSPHITLGRVKSDRPAEALSTAIGANAAWRGGEVDVTEILVLSSELTPKGPIYTVLSRAKLKGET
jgi:RNA 2',3'-cyclic 3'-phosphodiesterase